MYELLKGDNLVLLKGLKDNSVDAVVMDPPYGLKFMNKKWDYDVPSIEFWKEVLRVVKPGGHILSFGGTRTYHRMVVNCEEGGFEVRDCISYLYGSGFPKSYNIGKAIDGKIKTGALLETQEAKMFEGYGSALKPAQELILLARKPLSEPSIAENVMKWGTGGINIDGCRIVFKNDTDKQSAKPGSLNATGKYSMFGLKSGNELNDEGRFPANIIFDEETAKMLDKQTGTSKSQKRSKKHNKQDYEGRLYTPSATDYRDDNTYNDEGGASRFFYCAKVSKKERNLGCDEFIVEESGNKSYDVEGSNRKGKYDLSINKNSHPTVKPINLMSYLIKLVSPPNKPVAEGRLYTPSATDYRDDNTYNDEGGASRFFYCAKVSKKERNIGCEELEKNEVIRQGLAGEKNNPTHNNNHPTVKPINLMSYLIKLVSPPNKPVILDPFMGSGSTGIAALLNGYYFIGMEKDDSYFSIAEARISNYEKYRELLK